jgi:hypothetical protein
MGWTLNNVWVAGQISTYLLLLHLQGLGVVCIWLGTVGLGVVAYARLGITLGVGVYVIGEQKMSGCELRLFLLL